MTRVCLVSVLAALFLGGCPKSREGSDGGGDIPLESLSREMAISYCDLAFRCELASDDVAFIELLFDDVRTCAASLERGIFNIGKLDALARKVEEGTVVYDGAAARTCVDALRSDCSNPFGGSPAGVSDACDVIFTGTIPEGGECWVNEECAGDLDCEFVDGCPGTCGPDGGFPCGEMTGGCPADQVCFFGGSSSERCVSETLEADADEGEPCGLVEETATAVVRRGCRPGLWCTGSSVEEGTCRMPIAAGDACTSSDDVCVDGHLCVAGSCREITIVRTAGEPCGEEMLALCDPFGRLRCIGGTCLEFTDGEEGSPCETGDFGHATCNEGLVCHEASETCGPPLAAGSSCNYHGECASGSCDYRTGICRERYCDD